MSLLVQFLTGSESLTKSESLDVSGLGTSIGFFNLAAHLLAFCESPESSILDRSIMDEQILAIF
jgi:hypothetical protein